MILRATGKGHISSIVFRSGGLDRHNTFLFDPISDFVETPDLQLDAVYKRNIFQRKLNEAEPQFSKTIQNRSFKIIRWLADSNYEVGFHSDHSISERVIFPVSKNESSGIEDARFVQFFDNMQEVTYYATYTAYNDHTILPQLIETKDFIKFNILTLNSKAIKNKGMAIFPRKIGGLYVMLSRQNGENNHIMFSDDIHFWQESQIIQEPKHPWEFI